MADENVEGTGNMIPYARFAEVVSQKNKAESDKAAMEAKLQELTAQVSTYESKVQEAQAAAEAKAQEVVRMRLQHDMDVTLLRDGIGDKEVQGFLTYKYGTVEAKEDGTKPSFADWYNTYKATDPAVLKPFLKKAETQTQTETQGQTQDQTQGQTQTQGIKKAETAAVPDQSHAARTGSGEALSNLTPHSLARMTPDQIKQMGGMGEILKLLPKAN